MELSNCFRIPHIGQTMGTEIELWIKELTEAGWERTHSTMWKSPEGERFRGPYAAWLVMKSRGKV
jgi:hypothetical protein